jgi:hypothetical protein
MQVVLLVLFSNILFSQNKPEIKVSASKASVPVLSSIYIVNNGKVVDSTKTNNDGKGQFTIDIGNFYSVVVKANGYYDKTFFVDTKSITKERAKDKFNEVVAELEMVQKNKNYELINIKPSVLFYYDKGLDKFVYQEDSLEEALIRSEEFNLLVSFVDSTPIVMEQFVEYTRLCKEFQIKLDSSRVNLNAVKEEASFLKEKVESEKLVKIILCVGLIVLIVIIVILAMRLKRKTK